MYKIKHILEKYIEVNDNTERSGGEVLYFLLSLILRKISTWKAPSISD